MLTLLSSFRRGGLVFLALCGLLTSADAGSPMVIGGRCRQTGNSCDSTIGNAGGQGACCDPARPQATGHRTLEDCAFNNACTGGSPFRWSSANLPLAWYFNPSGRPSSGFQARQEVDYENAAKEAFAAWTKPACTSFQERYAGRTTATGPNVDNRVVLFFPSAAQWAQFGAGSGTLAFATPRPDRNARLLDADVLFNPGYTWGTGTVTTREVDFTAVAAHEIGHALGVAHSESRTALMYYASSGQGPEWATKFARKITSDDEKVICNLYPRLNCTTAADCGGCFTCGANQQCVLKAITPTANLCKPCTKPADCGGPNDICVRLEEGNRCAQGCDTNECCPSQYRCADMGLGQKMCIPESGACAPVACTTDANCGPGEACTASVCKPKPVALNPGSCKKCLNGACTTPLQCFQFPGGESRCVQPCVADLFCPTGHICRAAGSGRYCFPEDLVCPCSADTDCDTGQLCQQSVCRKPGGGTYGDVCSDKQPCATNFQCFDTQGGGICLQPCGKSASASPAGSPGAPCNNNTCTLGARCFSFQGGNLCMPENCSATGACSNGGQCYQVQGVGNICLCERTGECKSGLICNTTTMSQVFGQTIGACAPPNSGSACPTNFVCEDAQAQNAACGANSQLCVCLPGPGTRGVGEICNQTNGCKSGLECLLLSQGSQDGYCFEPCTQGQACKFGGQCIISAGNNKFFCACQTVAQCAAPQPQCKIVGQGFGFCVSGTTNPCGNGTCDAGENCTSCPADCKCPAGQTCQNNACVAPPLDCGNGTCQADKGENCTSCPADCKCPAGQACQNNACVAAVDCGNGTCQADKGENCASCPADCKCPAGQACQNNACVAAADCGDGTCQADKGENCTSCPADCKCAPGQACQNNACVAAADCGNGTCQADKGENCGSCPADCKCAPGQTCQNNLCQNPPQGETVKTDGGVTDETKLTCPVSDQYEVCNSDGKNCELRCPPAGCTCSSTPVGSFGPLFFLFALLFLRGRRRLS